MLRQDKQPEREREKKKPRRGHKGHYVESGFFYVEYVQDFAIMIYNTAVATKPAQRSP